jgi:hypothetical protein
MAKPLQIIMPERALGLVAEAAERTGCKSSTWARQALYAALRASGLDPTAIPAGDAGSLYDVVDGKQRYAWVDGDQIKSVSYHDAKPEHEGRTWLPVKHFDSEPFNPAAHWRLKPIVTIEGDHVRVEYPVVEKAEAV